jgi:hypothetical protein
MKCTLQLYNVHKGHILAPFDRQHPFHRTPVTCTLSATSKSAMALTSSSRKHLMAASIGLLLAILPLASSQGLPVQYGLLPLGDLTTVDQDGPYFVPEVQSFEVCVSNHVHCSVYVIMGVCTGGGGRAALQCRSLLLMMSCWQLLLHMQGPELHVNQISPAQSYK